MDTSPITSCLHGLQHKIGHVVEVHDSLFQFNQPNVDAHPPYIQIPKPGVYEPHPNVYG